MAAAVGASRRGRSARVSRRRWRGRDALAVWPNSHITRTLFWGWAAIVTACLATEAALNEMKEDETW